MVVKKTYLWNCVKEGRWLDGFSTDIRIR